MKFALLMYDNVQEWREASEEGRAAIGRRHSAFVGVLKQRGAWIGGLGYQAKTVRTQDPTAVTVADGTASDGMDQLGGLYLVEVADFDEAVGLAKLAPAPTVEVRPIAES